MLSNAEAVETLPCFIDSVDSELYKLYPIKILTFICRSYLFSQLHIPYEQGLTP